MKCICCNGPQSYDNAVAAIKSWCLENNVNEKEFYYWQCRVREEAYSSVEKTESNRQRSFVQLPVPADVSGNTPSFTADMIIHIGNNVLELSNTVSEELLSKVLKVMNDVK